MALARHYFLVDHFTCLCTAADEVIPAFHLAPGSELRDCESVLKGYVVKALPLGYELRG